jgi:zona occludens toxin (predicted ATPase)
MIFLYSGTPGSGKSLHAAYKIWASLKVIKRPVIANFPISFDKLSKNIFGKRLKDADNIESRFTYLDNQSLTVKYLQDFALEHHKLNREGQTLLIIDECAMMFNSRMWDMKGRQEWIFFFQQHRKLGYDIILIAQHDRLIDRQIRAFIETEYKHRAIKNYKFFGWILSLIFRGLFISIEYWYGTRLRCSSEMFVLNRRKASIYDTFKRIA